MNLTNSSSAVLPSHLTPAGQNLTNYEKSVFGGNYFFPFRGNVPLVFYNKTALSSAGISAPPATYSGLLKDLSTLKNKTGSGQLMIQGGSTNGARGGSSTATEMYQLMDQFGGNPLYLKDSGDIRAIQYLYNLTPYFASGFTSGYWGTYSGLAKGSYSLIHPESLTVHYQSYSLKVKRPSTGRNKWQAALKYAHSKVQSCCKRLRVRFL